MAPSSDQCPLWGNRVIGGNVTLIDIGLDDGVVYQLRLFSSKAVREIDQSPVAAVAQARITLVDLASLVVVSDIALEPPVVAEARKKTLLRRVNHCSVVVWRHRAE